MPWGKTEFWIMLENFGFEWIFLEPSRWKWLNMEIFKLSFSNWLLLDKELRGNIETEGENDQRISAFANCNVKLSGCQYFPPLPGQTINQFIKLIKVSEKWTDYLSHLGFTGAAIRWHFLAGLVDHWELTGPDWSIKPIISGSNLADSDDSSRETDPVLCSDVRLIISPPLPPPPLTTTYTKVNTSVENRPQEQHISVHSIWWSIRVRAGQKHIITRDKTGN